VGVSILTAFFSCILTDAALPFEPFGSGGFFYVLNISYYNGMTALGRPDREARLPGLCSERADMEE
jgi:hypothetical protein